jgi:hypothetical protein
MSAARTLSIRKTSSSSSASPGHILDPGLFWYHAIVFGIIIEPLTLA